MPAGDVQFPHAQTPGVERSHQTRPQQAEADQRRLSNIDDSARDSRMEQTQEAAEAQQTQIQLTKEKEREARDRARRSGEQPDTEDEEQAPAPRRQVKKPGMGDQLDITI